MKTSFSRTFFPATLLLVLALTLVGLFFQMFARNIMSASAMERLKADAQTVSELAEAYYSSGADPEDFYINLSVASNIAGASTVVCDREGVLQLCSDAPLGCAHRGLAVEKEYLERVIREGVVMDVGVVEGLYTDTRYVVSVPVLDDRGQALGIVIASSSVATTAAVLNALNKIYLTISVLTVLGSIIVMTILARRLNKPIRQLRKAAVDFGHGKLDARVKVAKKSPVEIQELALAFNNMAESLQKSEDQRQDFVANVSHELKTPMTTIAGFADGILDGTIPPEKQEHYLKLISQETKRLNRLVRSMLDISRLQEQGGIPEEQKTRFDVSEWAGQTLLTFEQKINSKNLQVEAQLPDRPVYTMANLDYITQVLYNLLDNAVKFCPAEGILELSVRTGGGKIYIGVANNGQVIPQEELPLVFERFHKLDKSRSENRDSWGLGLYIVKTIVGYHGEDISVTSAEGKTEFVFTLPLVN